MAIESFVIQETFPEPQVLFDIFHQHPQTNDKGEVTGYSKWHFYGVLKSRVVVTEHRGYKEKPTEGFTPANKTQPWYVGVTSTTDSSSTAGEGTYESYTKSVEFRRINEAGFWRVIETETWRSLYINGNKHSGEL
jgi:hypothetical protein